MLVSAVLEFNQYFTNVFGLHEVLVGLGRLVKVKGFSDQGFAVFGGERVNGGICAKFIACRHWKR